jgi:hypothetical protein
MPTTRTISAFNTATASENKIHDDAVASRFGFTGGLVPGVDVFAYLAHMPMARWGMDWLTGGFMQARFAKPVYDGDAATVTAVPQPDSSLALSISARGEVCATGTAGVGGVEPPAGLLPTGDMPNHDSRPSASPASLAKDHTLGALREVYTRDEGLSHIEAVRDDPALYDGGRVANAAWLLRRANYVLADNVRLGPWIHVESAISLHSLLRDGELLEVRAVVLDNVETKGHLMVVLNVQMLSGKRHVMSCRHWAIYEPRQVRQAAGP